MLREIRTGVLGYAIGLLGVIAVFGPVTFIPGWGTYVSGVAVLALFALHLRG